MQSTTHDPLTASAVIALAAILDAVMTEARVRRLIDGGDVAEGTMRALVVSPDRPFAVGGDVDIRDCYVHVSATFELYWPVSELVAQYGTGELAFG